MRIRRAILIAPLLALGFTGCTRNQIAAWFDWHESDPEAAYAFTRLDWVRDQMLHHNQPGEGDTSQIETARRDSEDATSGWGKWDPILQCETGGDWHLRVGNYEGGLMFLHSTWVAYGGQEYASRADLASPSQQIAIAEKVLDDVGWGAWPTCARRAGYR